MKVIISVVSLLLFSAYSYAQPERPGISTKDGNLVADTGEKRSVKGFGAHLIVIKDPRAFIEMWQKPERPKVDLARVVAPQEPMGVIVLFAGCKPTNDGDCDTEVDYWIYKPDGTLLLERIKQPLWKQKAPPRQNTQLGSAVLSLAMSDKLPVGEYRVKAKVHDINADVSFELQTVFELRK